MGKFFRSFPPLRPGPWSWKKEEQMILRKKFFRFLSVAVTVFLSVGQPTNFGIGFFDLFSIPAAEAATPTTLGYQGRLKNSSGVAQTGNFNFTFRLYASSTGGTAVYTETQNAVAVDQSFFAVQLGSVTPFPATFDFNQPLFLSTDVNGDGEMSPRVPINSVAYAYTAAGVTALATPPTSATGGRMYYNSNNNLLFYFDQGSSSWKTVRSATGTLQQITDEGNVTTNAIQFQGGTSTGAFTASSNLTVSGSSSLQGLTWTNATGTSVTTTNLFATNATITNFSTTNFNPTALTWTNATGTNTTTTWLGYSAASGTTETVFNVTSTGWLGFANATGTNLRLNVLTVGTCNGCGNSSASGTLLGDTNAWS